MTVESPVPEIESTKQDVDDSGPILTLIRQIKEYKLDPSVLSAEDRRRCVDVLGSEGYSVPEIAQILRRGERTIFRDRSELRAMHALRVHPQLALQVAGELVRQAECSVNRLRKIARESAASAMERSMAEQFAFKIHLDMITKLQSLGYLPRIPTGVVAQVVGASVGETIATLEQLAERIKELDAVDQTLGLQDPQRQEQRKALLESVQRGRVGAEIDKMLNTIRGEG